MFALDTAVPLDVLYKDKGQVSQLGAKPHFKDNRFVCWYVPAGVDLMPFERWWSDHIKDQFSQRLKKTEATNNMVIDNSSIKDPAPEKLIAKSSASTLYELLCQVKQAVNNAAPTPVWTVFEIANASHNSSANGFGHVYWEVIEKDGGGKEKAKARTAIWTGNRQILQKFESATGTHIQTGMKILAQVTVSYSELYGLSLIIQKINPAFTLGESELQLQQLRERLIAEGWYAKNRQLPIPAFFQRVAVIAPQEAAGLGDFNSVANKLVEVGLCEFHFVTATFQGKKAVEEISQAIRKVLELHDKLHFDALIMIRGGGDKSGLNELNHYSIAQPLCAFPVPVIVGIGHERDYTILDEICCVRCSTPSLTIAHIQQTIWGEIDALQQNIKMMAFTIERMINKGINACASLNQNIYHNGNSVLSNFEFRINQIENKIYNQNEIAKKQAEYFLSSQKNKISAHIDMIIKHSEYKVMTMDKRFDMIAVLNKTNSFVSSFMQDFSKEISNCITNAEQHHKTFTQSINHQIIQITNRSYSWYEIQQISFMANNPYAVLKRGYSLCFDATGRTVNSYITASKIGEFNVRFHDGHVSVKIKNLDI